MSNLGTHWKIDGVPAAYITPGVGNGRYRVVFERQAGAELEQIEGIHWERPEIELLAAGNEYGLPEGYGFEAVTITYDSHSRTYTVELKTASQYLGDVTGYQAQITELEAAAAEKASTIQAQTATISEQKDTIQKQASTIEGQAATIQELQEAGTAADLEAGLDAAYVEGVNSVE